MTAVIKLPASIDEVSAEWLTAALRQQRPGILVTVAEIQDYIGGACTKLRIRLTTNDPDFPETVIVKGCLEPHSAEMAPFQYCEAMIYAQAVPSLEGVETVTCYFTQADLELGSAIVMEDLDRRGVTCRNALEPITSYELAADYLASLARLHARWWDSPELHDGGRFGFLMDALTWKIPRMERIMSNPGEFSREIRKPQATCVSRSLLDGTALLRAYNGVKALSAAMPSTLTHGDMHPSNLYTTPEGRGGLLDWTSMRAPWARDVAYFIAGNLDPVERRRWEKPLLQFYLSCLTSLGVRTPGFEDAWFAYRIWMVWGIYVWLFNIPSYHSEEKITAMTYRYGTALVDHETLKLIDDRLR